MEIQGQQLNLQPNSSGKGAGMREGDIYNARIKTRLSGREAVISVRGQEVKAEFEGRVPQQDRVNIKVQERTMDGVKVKEIRDGAGTDGKRQFGSGRESGQSAERVLREMGHKEPSKELRQHTQRLIDRGVPLTRETVNGLNRYIESGRGTSQERTETIRAMAAKRLEPSAAQLRAVHEALHGRSAVNQVKEMTRDTVLRTEAAHSGPRDVRAEIIRGAEQVRSSLETGRNVRHAIEQLQQVAERSGDRATVRDVNHVLREMIQLQAAGGREAAADRMAVFIQSISAGSSSPDSGTVANSLLVSSQNNGAWSDLIQNTSDVRQAVQTIQAEAGRANLSAEAAVKLDRHINEALTKLNSGRELKARQIMMEAVQGLTPATAVNVPDSRAEMQQYMHNEIVQTAGTSAKNILITEVTERLAQAADEFKSFQRQAASQLNRIDIMIRQFRQQTVQQTQPMLDNVIKQLDRAIMKSDWMLYADMKTERKMLGASSRLADAKKMLAQGRTQEASQIVREVQRTLEQVNFRPSNQRVQHILHQEQEWREPRPQTHRLTSALENTARQLTAQDGSGRQVYEGMRSTGLMREADIANMLAAGKDISQNDQNQRNMKTLLMQMARSGEDESGRQQAQQALQNLTGQQLMSRTDTQQNMQMLLLNLPVMLKGEAENLQIYVNSRNDGEDIDWENCSLYFHIDTKKLGALGIVLNVADRALSVTLKNDSEGFGRIAEPIAQKYADNLKEVGFHLKGIQFAPMTRPDEPPAASQESGDASEVKGTDKRPVMTEKGFDYKI